MTATLDVYEELRRREAACQKRDGEYLAEYAYEAAADLVEFLRWRSASEEWPADGCECSIFAETPTLDDTGPKFQQMSYPALRKYTTRWRYALGPCPCAQPKGEGGPRP